MRRVIFGRRSKWLRFVYLCCATVIFLLATSQFKNYSTNAKYIPERRVELELVDVHSENVKKSPEDRLFVAEAVGPPRIETSSSTTQKPLEWTKKLSRRPKTTKKLENVVINGEKYPKLTPDGKFIPLRRIVHLDLKGAPYKPKYFTELFAFFNRLRATGVLLEWEDMFPFKGRLSGAVNKNAYTMDQVENILQEAKKHNLQIIPLVQTMGHLEWILKLPEFANLREDSRFPQVICFSDDNAWELIMEMIGEVAEVHKKYGMDYFHMGADEAFQIGICNSSVEKMKTEVTRERLMLWHIARTANFVKKTYPSTQVLAWHDMLATAMETDIDDYGLYDLVQPVLWNYAEDLDMYLPRSTWMILKNFRRVWGSSAWKGADGPARFATHAAHYVKNHESWIKQMTMVYKDFEVVEGLIMTGWSRYDHLAVLAETVPVALPTLAMSMETILEARPMMGNFPVTAELLQCSPPLDLGFTASGCRFPGSRIYEIVNELYQKKRQLRQYRDDDYELNGWLSRVADEYSVSSHWYIDKIEQMIRIHAEPIEQLVRSLRCEMDEIFFPDTATEFIFTYFGEDLEWFERKRDTIRKVSTAESFPVRPFVKSFMEKTTTCI